MGVAEPVGEHEAPQGEQHPDDDDRRTDDREGDPTASLVRERPMIALAGVATVVAPMAPKLTESAPSRVEDVW